MIRCLRKWKAINGTGSLNKTEGKTISEWGEKEGLDKHAEAAEERSSSEIEISLPRQGLSPETERTNQKNFPSPMETDSEQSNEGWSSGRSF